MNLVAKAVDKITNPPRVSDPDRLRAAVSGKTVLVTGASSGLGEATARKLGAAGATVLLVARSADRLAALAASINAGGGHAAAYPADLTDETAVAALGKKLTENHGPMDVVVSNAGKSIRRSLHLQYDRPQDFERTIGVNYLGPVRLLLGLLPAMRRRGSGHIVSVSTIGVLTAPGPRWGAYLASKSAFDVWLRSVAPELRADGVRVTSVYMTLVHTPMSEPTPILRRMPGLSAEQAADIVAKAIIDRPGSVQPLWVWPIEISSMLLPKALEVGMGLMYRFTTDSPSALGIRR
jgi:NAD(P)-dependent dehydrogenase (short-subunit alcohol dehydrogenase family)